MAVVAALLLATTVSSNAQTPVSVEKTFKGIVKKYEETTGVTCIAVVKGGGLEMVGKINISE